MLMAVLSSVAEPLARMLMLRCIWPVAQTVICPTPASLPSGGIS